MALGFSPTADYDNGPPTAIDVAARLAELDCDPIAGMAKIAQDERTPRAIRARIFAELATYVAPRQRAAQLSGPGERPIQLDESFDFTVLSDDEVQTLYDLVRKGARKERK